MRTGNNCVEFGVKIQSSCWKNGKTTLGKTFYRTLYIRRLFTLHCVHTRDWGHWQLSSTSGTAQEQKSWPWSWPWPQRPLALTFALASTPWPVTVVCFVLWLLWL